MALAPGARLRHAGSESSPTTLRSFLNDWRETWFDQHWHGPLEALAGRTATAVTHPCADWRTDAASGPRDAVSAVVGVEAGRMLVPLSRYAARERAAAEDVLEARIAELRAEAYQLSVDADSAASRAGWLEEHAAGQERQLAHQAEILAAAEAAATGPGAARAWRANGCGHSSSRWSGPSRGG